MKEHLIKRTPFGWMLAALALLALTPSLADAQPAVPPQAIEQFNHVIGRRVEALTILGGDYSAMGGLFTFRGGNIADVSVSKFGGGGMMTEPMSLGVGDIKWGPVLEGNFGQVSAENQFTNGFLEGNRSRYDTTALQAGGGARFFLTDNLSLAPTISGIYGHTSNEFTPQNAVGDVVKAAGSGTYVDWELDTWSVAPSLDVRYTFKLKRTTFELSSRYSYFHTESYNSTSPVISLSGDSDLWENKLDVDVPLGWKLFNRELHTGGFFMRTDLTGTAANGIRENHVYTANGRFVLDVTPNKFLVRWIGVGCSYLWGDNFNGWSAGVALTLDF